MPNTLLATTRELLFSEYLKTPGGRDKLAAAYLIPLENRRDRARAAAIRLDWMDDGCYARHLRMGLANGFLADLKRFRASWTGEETFDKVRFLNTVSDLGVVTAELEALLRQIPAAPKRPVRENL